MKTGLFTLLFLLVPATSSWAQVPPTKEELDGYYKKKLEKEFIAKAEWKTTFADAKKASVEKNLPILMYFTRSFAT